MELFEPNSSTTRHSMWASLLTHRVIIGPPIESRQLNILLAQQRSDLRAMIDAVVDGLDQDDDDRRVIRSTIKMQNLAQVYLLRNGKQLFARTLYPSP